MQCVKAIEILKKLCRWRQAAAAVPFAVAAHADDRGPRRHDVDAGILKLPLIADIDKIIIAAVYSLNRRAVEGLAKIIPAGKPRMTLSAVRSSAQPGTSTMTSIRGFIQACNKKKETFPPPFNQSLSGNCLLNNNLAFKLFDILAQLRNGAAAGGLAQHIVELALLHKAQACN